MEWSGLTLGEIKSHLEDLEEDNLLCVLAILEKDRRKGVQDLAARYRRLIHNREVEERRLLLLEEKEAALRKKGYTLVAGIDEAGRGPLAGPVVAGCVIMEPGCHLRGLNDSKLVTPQERQRLAEEIRKEAVAWGIGVVNAQEIDEINILQATRKAMAEAVRQMAQQPDYLLIDALKIPVPIPQEGVVHGDRLCACIAAASILAKTYRDHLMEMMDVLYPQYGFKDNKGYGTPHHLEALSKFGPCPIHRRSFLPFLQTGTD